MDNLFLVLGAVALLAIVGIFYVVARKPRQP
jgi:hypothetical protein